MTSLADVEGISYEATNLELIVPAQAMVEHPLQWRHNGRDGVSNHQSHDCFLAV